MRRMICRLRCVWLEFRLATAQLDVAAEVHRSRQTIEQLDEKVRRLKGALIAAETEEILLGVGK